MSIIHSAKTSRLDTNKYPVYLFNKLYKITLYENDLKDGNILRSKFKEIKYLLLWNKEIIKAFQMKEISR